MRLAARYDTEPPGPSETDVIRLLPLATKLRPDQLLTYRRLKTWLSVNVTLQRLERMMAVMTLP